ARRNRSDLRDQSPFATVEGARGLQDVPRQRGPLHEGSSRSLGGGSYGRLRRAITGRDAACRVSTGDFQRLPAATASHTYSGDFGFDWHKHPLHRCWTQAAIAAVSAMESRSGTEVSSSN